MLSSRTALPLGPLLATVAILTAAAALPSAPAHRSHPGVLTAASANVADAATSSALPSSPQSSTVTLLGRNMAAVGWSSATNQIVYNRRGADHLWDAYTANPDGSNEKCLTCNLSLPGPGTRSQRGAYSVSRDGKYVLATVEGPHHGVPYGMENAAPGKGASNDIWLMRIDGSGAWQLTHAAQDHNLGTLWADFDRTGNRMVWAQLTAMASPLAPFGTWLVKVASISWTGGVPSLTNIVTRRPQAGKFYEPYAFTPDGSGILMSSDYKMPHAFASQIWVMDIATGAMKRLSPADVPPNLLAQIGPFSNYNEFAQYTPDNSRIIFGRTRGDNAGMDYWSMRPDGSDPHRLTFTGESWSSQSLGYGNFVGFAFDPKNPNRIFAGRCRDTLCTTIDSYFINTGVGGLTASYYTDTGCTQLLGKRMENPSNSVEFSPVPMPGLPSSHFGVRWTGVLTAPKSGTYTFSSRTSPGSEMAVTIDGTALPSARAKGAPSGSSSATVNLGAGRHAVSFSYSGGGAGGYEQVLWTVPGSSSATTIPMSALTPG